MAYGHFRYPVVRRRSGEPEGAYWQRRQETRSAALARWRAEREARRAAGGVNQRETFDSWLEFVSRAERTTNQSEQSHTASASWTGGADFEEARRLARDGWQDGAERLADMTARLEGRLATHTTVMRPGYSVVGPGVLDMGRYLNGHPEPFMVWREGEESSDTASPRGVLRVLVSGSASSGTDAETIFWRGAAAVAIVDMAERSGARVEVELVFRVRNSNGYDGAQHSGDTRILLKRAQDHVPTELLAFALAHPATLRRLCFGYWETLPADVRAALAFTRRGYYGYPQDVPEDERGDVIYIPALTYGAEFRSAESTAEWVIEQLANHGIEVEKP